MTVNHQMEEESRRLTEELQLLVEVALRELMQQGVEHHRLGRLDEAQAAYLTILGERPQHADANHNLAVILLAAGNHAGALAHFKAALESQPNNWQYWISYVDALIQADQNWLAATVLEDARRAGIAADVIDELLGRLMSKVSAVTATVAAVPKSDSPSAEDVVTLSELLKVQRFEELQRISGGLAQRFPQGPFGWKMLGLALLAQGKNQEAVIPLLKVVEICPADGDNLNTLGLAYIKQCRLVEAEFSFRLANHFVPQQSQALSNLGMALQMRGRLDQAAVCLRQCLAQDERSPAAHLNLSVVLDKLGRPEEAEASVRRALQIKPDFVLALVNLGYQLKDQCRIEEAEACIRQALALDPKAAEAHSNLLYILNYHPDRSPEEIFSAYQEYNRQLGLPFRAHWKAHANSRETRRRLKVGYVCPVFGIHSTRHFLEPLLAHHDHGRVEVVAYSESISEHDGTTWRYRSYFDQWVATSGMSDDALAARIRADGIDVLVDIAGHTFGNRLGVFARKPAPVSLHWLDFGYTTGLTAIDYYLTDYATVPPGSEALFSEEPWRLPVPALAYRPAPDMGPVGPLPALQRGGITFGTLTRAIRINHRTVRVWVEILGRVPGSRLVINSSDFKGAAAQEAMAQKFSAYGIARHRLDFGFSSPPWDVLREIDIGLDCFPHNSGTTLFEMLYMGVPYVTLAGRPSVGRLGSAILEGIGHPEWIAWSEQEYVEKVVALAKDSVGLAHVRASLRAEMQASAVMDEAGFARHVEEAYVKMFERWRRSEPESACSSEFEPVGGGNPQEPALLNDVAQTMYRAISSAQSLHPEANRRETVVFVEPRPTSTSLPYFREALAREPENWHFWRNCYVALLDAKEFAAATDMLEQKQRIGLPISTMTSLIEELVDGRYEFEVSNSRKATGSEGDKKGFKRKKQKSGATARVDQISQIKVLFNNNRFSEVADLSRAILKDFPSDSFCWKALGASLIKLGRFVEALLPLRKAVDLSPGDCSALSNFGFALQIQCRPIEAEVNLRLALKYQPNFAPAMNSLGLVFLSQDRHEEAAALYLEVLSTDPSYFPAHGQLAKVRIEQGRLVEAMSGLRTGLELMTASDRDQNADRFIQERAIAHQDLGRAYAQLSDFENVVSESNAAMDLMPNHPGIWESRLYLFSYHPDLAVGDIFSEFVRWGDQFARPVSDFSDHDRTPRRRLKVGYVSPDFRRHTSRFYFLPLFSNHDREVVEIYAYSNVKTADEFTDKFHAVFDHWRDIRACSDDEVAALVRADGIDILVDGCNHMRDDRLGVFALKPAPIQVTWLGAAWTTGLQAVDYVLFDQYIAPPETITRESIVRLPHCFASFEALTETDVPQAPPCLKNGYITFGYSGRTERLNHRTFAAWGKILQRMPTARLVLDFRSFSNAPNQEYYRNLMRQHGVDVERVVMRNSSNIFKGLHDFDILLDSFPHSGGTMLVDALWMGVPTLTLAGRPPLGRIGTTFMMNLDLPHWIAWSEDEYVEKACALASDVDGLSELRAGMRSRMQQSPFMDAKAFARHVEWAYQSMWRSFCAGDLPSPINVPPQQGGKS